MALQTALLALVLPAATYGADMEGAALPRGALHAKLRYCTGCHGPSGRGFPGGYYPIPRLAGQQPEYIENQLHAFQEGRRERQLVMRMSKVHGLNPAMQSALAVRFTAFHPAPISGGPRRLIEAGKKLYEEGDPDANVPACAACHGPQALGDGITPRLAGQGYRYLTKELTGWQKERGQNPEEDTSAIMAPIAQSLTKPQIQAVAAYLSHLD